MQYTHKHMRRLPLAGAPNTRDLGGFPCEGGVTRWKVFLRSASTAVMTAEDLAVLRAYGVTTVVDLRSAPECEREPSVIEKAPGFSYHCVSLLDNLNSSNFEGEIPGSMAGMYVSLLDESTPLLGKVFRILAQAEDGVLFHCTAGKDRTGIVAMLLLKLAGVSDADVEADYSTTEIYMRDVFAAQKEAIRKAGLRGEVPDHGFRSVPESIRHTLQHLAKKYATAQDYLRFAGVSEEEIAVLRQKMIDNE